MNNIDVFDKGITRAKQLIDAQLKEACRSIMWEMLVDAIGNYTSFQMSDEGSDKYLTGNTINAFGCGLYDDGRLIAYTIAREAGVAPPTSDYAYPGKRYYYEHAYGKHGGEWINPTMQYGSPNLSFQPVPRGITGDDASRTFLESYKAPKGLVIMICNAVPYADYLRTKRNFDILTTTFLNTEQLAERIFSTTRKI